jgi:glycosyltransferase involved in cell wall biosynthesis
VKALIVDPALHSMGGHHFNATLALNAELSALGIDHSCLASASADARVTNELGGTPCFTRPVYGRTYRAEREFRDNARQTRRELSRALRGHGSMPDLLILPCCDQVLALAVAAYLRRNWFARPPRIVLWLLFGPHCKKATDDPSLAPLYDECREAFAALREAVGPRRITAFCETAGMAEAYRNVTGLAIGVAPGPGLISGLGGSREPARRTGRPDGPMLVSLGFANDAKGYRLLPEAIEHVLAEDRQVRFMIHGVFNGSDAEDQASVFEHLARLGPRVAVRTDVLSPSDYLSCLGQADLLLLPYDPEVYRTRGSGVFAEAQRMGIPVVATKGCGFARPAFDQGWGAEIPGADSRSVAGAVLHALGKLDDMTACARSAARAAPSGGDTGTILRSAVAAIRAAAPATGARRLRRLFR